jgi:hypothetical protein
VYRALADVLQKDPVLSGIDITWDVRRGDRGEAMPPNARAMPWVALVPLEMPLKPGTETDDEARFRVRIDLAVSGTCWDDLANFAMAIRSALDRNKPYDDTQTVDEYFGSAGANNYWYRQGGIGVRRTESPPAGTDTGSPPAVTDQVAAAVVEFELFLPNIR